MAMVLGAFTSYVQNMLTEMAKEEARMLLGVPEEMTKMNARLGVIRNFLADADRRNITDESVQGWVKEFKSVMYDASDILDLCKLKAMKRGPSKDMGCFNPLLFCMRNPLHAHDIGSRLKALNKKLDGIEQSSRTFNFMVLNPYEENNKKKESTLSGRRETTEGSDKLDLVGMKIEEDTRNLVDLLTREKIIDEHNKILVFAIVGAGGIGKTSLAQKIYHNETIKNVFTKKIWLSVNQDCSETELLRRTIEVGGGNQAAGNTMVTLVKTLKETLEGCKTLLVLDDVWNNLAWGTVLETLREVLAQGSRALVTTRDDRVAKDMRAEEPYHHVNKLDPEDAWSLLKKEVTQNNNEPQVDMLKDIGMEILAKCDGLPLAVKVMGGLLRQKEARRSYWLNILNYSAWSVSKMPEELNYAIYLSYQDMDPSLKPCFLHFSLLPKSTIFGVDDIVGMWISEGFVNGGSHLEELGRKYYDELILRNLLEPNMKYVDQEVCNMHDVVRSFAQYVARDEALAAHGGQTDIIIDKLNSEKFIRLSLETKGFESNGIKWLSLQTQISLRTLISTGPIKINSGDSLVAFSSLRTLHVEGTTIDALSESLVKLQHLRYLSLPNSNISTLPENIGKMKFLQYIKLIWCHSLLKLPDSIGELPHLWFLNIHCTSINSVPKGFSRLTSLRKLIGFPTQIDGDWCSLEELGPLSKLTHLSIHGLENLSDSSFARKARLCEKDCLVDLSLECTRRRHGDDGQLSTDVENIFEREQQQIEGVFDELCPPACLETLCIHGYFGQRLPTWMMSTTTMPLRSLRTLFMEDLRCCTELPDNLYQLPCLEFLQIERAPAIKHVGPDFLQPQYHKHRSDLENLGSAVRVVVIKCPILERISNLHNTQELRIIVCPKLKVVTDMPALQTLVLEDYDMETLPGYLRGYLRDINPRHLRVQCDISLLTSMATGKSGPEWVKFSHMQQVKAYARDDIKNFERKWYVLYTRDPFSFVTNIDRSAILRARRDRAERLWQAYEDTCPVEEWTVGRWDVDKRRPLCHRFRCNAYRQLVLWLRGECLHCREAERIADSSDQWTEAAVYPAWTIVSLTAEQFARPQ